MPLRMYAPAWMPVSTIVKTLLAEVKSPLSSEFDMSHLMIDEPASNCRINPAVTMGPMPSSISVPRLEAKITLNEPNWSEADCCNPVEWDFSHDKENN